MLKRCEFEDETPDWTHLSRALDFRGGLGFEGLETLIHPELVLAAVCSIRAKIVGGMVNSIRPPDSIESPSKGPA